MLKRVALFTIVIYDCQIFIVLVIDHFSTI
jgi:hypothetical protein